MRDTRSSRVGRVCVVAAIFIVALAASAARASAATGELGASFLADKTPQFMELQAAGGGQAAATAAGVPNIDSLQNFTVPFSAPGFDYADQPRSDWSATFVGRPPSTRGTTEINAPIIPVVVELLNADGTIRQIGGKLAIYAPFDQILPTLRSPVFSESRWSSSATPTQITDAVQRAEFYNQARPNWHTLLSPRLRLPRIMKLAFGSYLFATKSDGTCCAFVLAEGNAFVSKLFPQTVPVDNTTVIGAAEIAGDITTRDLSTFLFPNTFLYFGNPSNCCVIGFHSYDYEPGDATNGNLERRYVLNYSSWISPGLFSGGFEDVTALSHEVAETYNDPFVDNATPWWLAPFGLCQNNLETGDVIEGLPNATYPVTMNGYTYHPQNEALFQYFEFKTPSDALHQAYSYPDETVLSGPSTLQHAFCP